jgi:hypothetical protein
MVRRQAFWTSSGASADLRAPVHVPKLSHLSLNAEVCEKKQYRNNRRKEEGGKEGHTEHVKQWRRDPKEARE